jgi:Flp pilus assembly protein TadD
MRILLDYLSSASKPAVLAMGMGVLLVAATPSFAQNDILLPAADAPPVVDEATPDPTFEEPDPAALATPAEAPADDAALQDLLKNIDEGAEQVKAPADPGIPEITPQVVDTAPPAVTGTETVIPTAEPSPVVAPTGAVPTPTDAALVPAPTPEAAAAATANATEATDVPTIPALPPDETPSEDLFFDADTLVPTGEMGANAPRKVNPALQPASKLIVVKKDYDSGSRQAQLVSAERAIALGRYDSALALYNKLYEKNSRDQNVIMGRAIALQHLGMDDEAVMAYEQILDLNPDNTQAQVNMLGLMGQRYPAVALQRLRELSDKEPDNLAIVGQIAVLHANLGQYDDAFKYLGMAASLEPNNANHLFNMAVVADRAGKKSEAITYYEQALEVDSIYGGGRSIPREAVFERLARLR